MKKYIKAYLETHFDEKRAPEIYQDAVNRYEQLKARTVDKSENQKKYLEGSIYPAIAVYEALQKSGLEKETAHRHMREMVDGHTRNSARKMWKRLGRLPFFFPLFKKMFSIGLLGDSWEVTWVANDKTRFEYTINKCLWHSTFSEYGCPELCAIFCHNDEINFTDVSRHMRFERKNALGYGDSCCDFHFYSGGK